jgi:hypothetical protein
MMQLARRTSLAVVLLLASVGTASAECGWAMWIAFSGSPVEWSVQATFLSQQPCMTEARRLTRVGLRAPDDALDDLVGAVVLLKNKQGQIEKAVNYECWQDTLEPRKLRRKSP